MNLELLKPFDLEAARNNEPVLWYGNDVEFVGIDNQGGIALCIDGLIRIVSKSSLRMKPLAWVEEKPVYKGDVLYSQITGKESSADGTETTGLFTWTKPEPVKKTRTVKFLGYMTLNGSINLINAEISPWPHCKRVPSADVTYEVEE